MAAVLVGCGVPLDEAKIKKSVANRVQGAEIVEFDLRDLGFDDGKHHFIALCILKWFDENVGDAAGYSYAWADGAEESSGIEIGEFHQDDQRMTYDKARQKLRVRAKLMGVFHK